MKTHPLFLALFVLLLLPLAACDSGGAMEEEEPPPEAPPSFEIATRSVTLVDNTPGIEFYVRPNEDIVLVRVDMQTPLGGSITFNAGSSTIVRNESFALQDPGTAYTKISGNWTFTLVGSRAAGTRASFNVNQSVNVSAAASQ